MRPASGTIDAENRGLTPRALVEQAVEALARIPVISGEQFVRTLTVERYGDAVFPGQLVHTVLRIDAGASEGLALRNNHVVQVAGQLERLHHDCMGPCADVVVDRCTQSSSDTGAPGATKLNVFSSVEGCTCLMAQTMAAESMPPERAAPSGTSLRRCSFTLSRNSSRSRRPLP